MNSKNVKRVLLVLFIIIVNLIVLNFSNVKPSTSFNLQYEIKADKASTYQVFYTYETDFGEYVINQTYSNADAKQTLTFSIPKEATRIRLDLGEEIAHLKLDNLKIKSKLVSKDIVSLIDTDPGSMNNIESINILDKAIEVVTNGTDPFITINLNNVQNEILDKGEQQLNYIIKIVSCILINLILFICIKKRNIMKVLIKEIYGGRRLILNLSKNDFKTKYAGSYLGITWAFIQPIVVVLIYWFVFEIGLKSTPMEDFPYLLWLIAGIVPWFFFNEAINNATNSMIEYSYLVKKVVFKISILPIVKIMSAFYVHLFFILFANIIYMLYGYMPTIYMIQALYYSACTFILVLAITYATSAMIVFFKDLGQIVSILLQFGMWVTPIMWSFDFIPQHIQWMLKLNPMHYIVEGYRDTFIRHVWFWERYNQTIYFWGISMGLFVIGAIIFKKLKPHFADVL